MLAQYQIAETVLKICEKANTFFNKRNFKITLVLCGWVGGVTGEEGKGDFSPGYCIADPGFFKGQTGFAFCKGRGGGER